MWQKQEDRQDYKTVENKEENEVGGGNQKLVVGRRSLPYYDIKDKISLILEPQKPK